MNWRIHKTILILLFGIFISIALSILISPAFILFIPFIYVGSWNKKINKKRNKRNK